MYLAFLTLALGQTVPFDFERYPNDFERYPFDYACAVKRLGSASLGPPIERDSRGRRGPLTPRWAGEEGFYCARIRVGTTGSETTNPESDRRSSEAGASIVTTRAGEVKKNLRKNHRKAQKPTDKAYGNEYGNGLRQRHTPSAYDHDTNYRRVTAYGHGIRPIAYACGGSGYNGERALPTAYRRYLVGHIVRYPNEVERYPFEVVRHPFDTRSTSTRMSQAPLSLTWGGASNDIRPTVAIWEP